MTRTPRRWTIAGLVLGLIVASAACGTADAGGPSAATPETCAGKEISLVEAVPPTVSPTMGDLEATVREAAAALGWNVTVAAANGTPSNMAAVLENRLAANADAIINAGIQPAAATDVLRSAKTAKTPVIGVGVVYDDPDKLLTAAYSPDEPQLADLLVAQMRRDYPNGGQALRLDASTIPTVVARQAALDQAVAGTNIVVAATHETNLPNGPKDTANAVTTLRRNDPRINMIWALQGYQIGASLQALGTDGLAPAGVYGFLPTPDAFAAMRAWQPGQAPIVAVDTPTQYSAWYAFDTLVNQLCRGSARPVVQQSERPLPVRVIVAGSTDPTTQPPSGGAVEWEPFAPYFLEKWRKAGAIT